MVRGLISTASDLMNLRHWTARYLMGLGLVGLALVVRTAIGPLLPPGFPFLTFFPAIILATFLAGRGPGVLCAGLSALAGWYAFIPPELSVKTDGQAVVATAIFAAVAAIDIAIIDRLIRALRALKAERRRALALAAQRETLFKELQHRIGNNLHSVSALLNIQARSVSDPEARRALVDAVQRVAVIGDIHRMFHDPAHADGHFDEDFVRELAQRCVKTAARSVDIAITTDIEPIALPQQTFLPVALILTECVNNAIEHGLAGRRDGQIWITLRRLDGTGRAELSIRDNGAGLPEGFDPAGAGSIGLKVLRAFASQLGASFTMTGGDGTVCLLIFDIPADGHGDEASADPEPEAADQA